MTWSPSSVGGRSCAARRGNPSGELLPRWYPRAAPMESGDQGFGAQRFQRTAVGGPGTACRGPGFRERASMVELGDGVWHAETVVVQVPSVVRLLSYVHVPFNRRAALTRNAVFARDDHRCQYCHGPADSVDHVVPRSRGGGPQLGQRGGVLPSLQPPQGDRSPAEAWSRPPPPPGLATSLRLDLRLGGAPGRSALASVSRRVGLVTIVLSTKHVRAQPLSPCPYVDEPSRVGVPVVDHGEDGLAGQRALPG